MQELKTTARSTMKSHADRENKDRSVVNAILDEALDCHVAFVVDGQPFVIPSTPWRVGDWLYLHGGLNSRLIRHIASGASIAVSVAMVDSLVMARSAMRHSSDFRSVVLFGQGEEVVDPDEKRRVLMIMIDKLSPGRAALVRPPNDKELAVTGVVRLRIDEGAAKVRSAPPTKVALDEDWNVWSGSIMLKTKAASFIPTEDAAGLQLPALPEWMERE